MKSGNTFTFVSLLRLIFYLDLRWLYKNSTVVSVQEIEGDSQLQRANVIITIPKLRQFKHQHLDKRNKKVKS